MPAPPEVKVTLTDRYQTTVPKTVRRAQFLGFMANDMAAHPERLQAINNPFVQRIQSLVAGVDVDLNAPLSEDDE